MEDEDAFIISCIANIMAADALAPYVTWSSAAMILT